SNFAFSSPEVTQFGYTNLIVSPSAQLNSARPIDSRWSTHFLASPRNSFENSNERQGIGFVIPLNAGSSKPSTSILQKAGHPYRKTRVSRVVMGTRCVLVHSDSLAKRPWVFHFSDMVEIVDAPSQTASSPSPSWSPRALSTRTTFLSCPNRSRSLRRLDASGSTQMTLAPRARKTSVVRPTFAPISKHRSPRRMNRG